jgi:flagellar brake protein
MLRIDLRTHTDSPSSISPNPRRTGHDQAASTHRTTGGAAPTSPELSLEYRVTTKPEIVAIVRQLIQDNVLAKLHVGASGNAAITRILALTPTLDGIIVDGGFDALTARLVESGGESCDRPAITIEAHHQRIRILFDVDQALPAWHDGRPAYRFSIPRSIARQQRRAVYRAKTPVLKPCTITLRLNPADSVNEIRISDLCCGGLSFCVSAEDDFPSAGAFIESVALKIPDVGTFYVRLEIRHVSNFRDGLDRSMRRVGCRFMNLKPNDEVQIQRYVNAIEALRRRTTLEF